MTPLEIDMMLHFYCRADSYPWRGAPAEQAALQRFREEGLVVEPLNVDKVKLTDRGRAYVNFLMDMPLPVAKWSLPGYTLPAEGGGVQC